MKRSQARKWEPRPQTEASTRDRSVKQSRLSLAIRTLLLRKRETSESLVLQAPLAEPSPPPPPGAKVLPEEPGAADDPLLPLILESLSSSEKAPNALRAELVQWAEDTAEPPSSRVPASIAPGLELHFEAPLPLRDRLLDWAAETAPAEPLSVLEHFPLRPSKTSEALVRARQTPVPADPFAALWSKLLGRGISLFARGKRLARALLGRLRTKNRSQR